MDTVVVSHPMYKPGMDVLDGKVNVVVTNDGDSDRILEELKNADGFILRIGHISREAIEACPRLRVITRPGVGVDNVDVDAATENGIPVVICPSANYHAVAEHTLMLVLALSKNLQESVEENHKGNFSIRSKYAASEVAGKTISVLGFGRIGREVARLCAAIGMHICVYDPYLHAQQVEELGYHFEATLDDAIRDGDYVTLHMPSTPQTRHLIGARQLHEFKKTAFLVNCARGDIVDEDALVNALKDGSLAGAGLDVLSTEPMSPDNPLFQFSNVLITPHMAAQTQETTGKTVVLAAEGTLAVLRGEMWNSVCNPEVYETEAWREKAKKC